MDPDDPAGLTAAQRRFLTELDRWVAEHGDAVVPQAAVVTTAGGEDYRLGLRVMEARRDGRRGTLPDQMRRELEQRRGWRWEIQTEQQQQAWHSRLAELRRHLEAGHALDDLPTSVHRWLVQQRRLLADGRLEHDRAEQLHAIPGALVRGDTRVHAFVAAARRWLAEHDDDVTMAHLRHADTVVVDGRPVPLGRQATYYRRRHHGLAGTHPLPQHEIDLIAQLPGWRWELDERRRNRRRAASQPSSEPEVSHSDPAAPGPTGRGQVSDRRGTA